MTENQVKPPPSNLPTVSQSPDDKPDFDGPKTAAQKQLPPLSHRSLTIMLLLMCIVPMVTIGLLWMYLPSVQEGQLEARVTAEGLPSAEYYETVYDQRAPHEGGTLIVENTGDDDWTHLINIQINRHYQIYDSETLPAGESRTYQLDRFWNRTGAIFSLRYNNLKSVRIYARRPNNGRATFFQEFDVEQ